MNATSSDLSESAFQQALADPAFDPRPGFDFVEANDAVLRGMHDSDAAALNMFNHEAHSQSSPSTTAHSSAQSPPSFSPYLGSTGAFAPGVDPVDLAGTSTSMLLGDFARIHAPLYLAPTTLSRIAQGRSDSVAERHGQVTPPESTPSQRGGRKSSASSSKSGQTTNLVRTERARHAANQRHARSKQPRQIREERAGSKPGESVEEDEDVETKKEKYREKNRIAAAKCRAKKKDNTDGLEERHRDLQASHNFLKLEDRRLRDELSTLRTLALQHSPDTLGCSCTNLHNYNRCKASEVAQGFNGPMVASPSDSVLSAGGLYGMSQTNSLSPASKAELYSRPQPFPYNGSYAPAPVKLPEMYDRAMVAGSADMQQDFSCYLEDSAERSGFMR
ncbi:hypothetical protein LTR56_025267 [Elasticomyces elasticus]|nr:hypothetical protein LTR56_025267 [Elasticomyces elasticus]KAK4903805.1 hypothetical protein LTR49_026631 [Elasticomyces elasticus]KAK5734540.1 hypothetical protein LTS12_026689 [Elasticomyces elasticus]